MTLEPPHGLMAVDTDSRWYLHDTHHPSDEPHGPFGSIEEAFAYAGALTDFAERRRARDLTEMAFFSCRCGRVLLGRDQAPEHPVYPAEGLVDIDGYLMCPGCDSSLLAALPYPAPSPSRPWRWGWTSA